MKDREFLMWLHERLEHVHGERPTMDYMNRFRAVIHNMSPDELALGEGCNSLQQLKYLIAERER